MSPAHVLASRECEIPPEAPDGVITDFTVSAYKPGTVSVWINGFRRVASLDTGFDELPPTTIRMKEPPFAGDTVEVQFEPA